MAALTMTSEYSVGIEEIDRQHGELFAILQRMREAMSGEAAPSPVGLLLKALLDATRGHFAAEEEFLEGAHYPELEQHRAEHCELTRRAEAYCARCGSGENGFNMHLHNFLRDWLKHHIMTRDQEYATWLREQPERWRPAAKASFDEKLREEIGR